MEKRKKGNPSFRIYLNTFTRDGRVIFFGIATKALLSVVATSASKNGLQAMISCIGGGLWFFSPPLVTGCFHCPRGSKCHHFDHRRFVRTRTHARTTAQGKSTWCVFCSFVPHKNSNFAWKYYLAQHLLVLLLWNLQCSFLSGRWTQCSWLNSNVLFRPIPMNCSVVRIVQLFSHCGDRKRNQFEIHDGHCTSTPASCSCECLQMNSCLSNHTDAQQMKM